MPPSPRDLVRSVATLETLPDIYQRLTDVMLRPNASTKDIAPVVSEDPGLAARLLRLVNSAFYALPTKVETVTQAVTLVGTEQLRELALATAVVGMFKNLPPDLVDMRSFWKHSLACGVAARLIAKHQRNPNIERFFVAGLLHDIGCLVVYQKAPHLARQVLERSAERQELRHVVEQLAFGWTHAQVGSELMRAWQLPAVYVEAVGRHHRPSSAQQYPVEVAAVHVADIIANALLDESSGERMVPPVDPQAWELLNLSEGRLESLFDEHEKQFQQAANIILGGPS